MRVGAPQGCLVCSGTTWIALPDPGTCSMTSDWRVVHERLARSMCASCGLIRREQTGSAGASFYASGYGLYAHAPGDARERARQDEYAAWIVTNLDRAPARVLDVGCGNGTLLRALQAHWPGAELFGCDPSADSIASGSGDGVRLWTGTASDLPDDVRADVVVAVNVIEHTEDPMAFLAALRRTLRPDGRLVIVCPDGTEPGLDLLFADHLFSFGRDHLDALFDRAGLDRMASSRAPASLGAFQMSVGRAADVASQPDRGDRHDIDRGGRLEFDRGGRLESDRGGRLEFDRGGRLQAARDYLDRWRHLDDRLQPRVGSRAVCFGASEAAGLLRAYATRTWASVRACTVDGRSEGIFGTLPLVPLESVGRDETILLGVRPNDQPRLAERLSARFARVVTWYDLV
jgi:SAM-dependent methyltransferase